MSMPITRSEAKVARTYECEHCHGFFSRQGISAHEAACLKTRTPFYVPETPPPPPAPVLMASQTMQTAPITHYVPPQRDNTQNSQQTNTAGNKNHSTTIIQTFQQPNCGTPTPSFWSVWDWVRAMQRYFWGAEVLASLSVYEMLWFMFHVACYYTVYQILRRETVTVWLAARIFVKMCRAQDLDIAQQLVQVSMQCTWPVLYPFDCHKPLDLRKIYHWNEKEAQEEDLFEFSSCEDYESYRKKYSAVCGPIDSFFLDLAYNTVPFQQKGQTMPTCTDGRKRGCLPSWVEGGSAPHFIKNFKQLKLYYDGKLKFKESEVDKLWQYKEKNEEDKKEQEQEPEKEED